MEEVKKRFEDLRAVITAQYNRSMNRFDSIQAAANFHHDKTASKLDFAEANPFQNTVLILAAVFAILVVLGFGHRQILEIRASKE